MHSIQTSPKKNILFLCTGNACRSQMAEGLCRSLKGDLYNVYSAGLETHGLNPYAVKALAEIDIDISSHTSKTLDQLAAVRFDEVVTVCANADQSCPDFPGQTRVSHVGFDDPPMLAPNAQNEAQKLVPFRRVRDEIRAFILSLPEGLQA